MCVVGRRDAALGWVTVRPMFGMRAFYRVKVVFAMLPEKRALGSPQAIAYKVTQGVTKGEGRNGSCSRLRARKESERRWRCWGRRIGRPGGDGGRVVDWCGVM